MKILPVTLILQVIARRKAADAAATAAKQDPVKHQTTSNGEKYALPTKPPAKPQGASICNLLKSLNIFHSMAIIIRSINKNKHGEYLSVNGTILFIVASIMVHG